MVYGSNGGRLAREDDPCAPTAAYPVSKLGAERFLLALATDGFDVRVLRLVPREVGHLDVFLMPNASLFMNR